MQTDAKYFRLFSSCQLVKGATAGLLIDLDRYSLFEIPLAYLDFITEAQNDPIETVKQKHGEGFLSFMQQFIDAELAFLTSEPQAFPPIDLDWKSPYRISNAVLQIANLENYNISDAIQQLLALDCQAFQLRFEQKVSMTELNSVLKNFEQSRAKMVELFIPNKAAASCIDDMRKLLKSEHRVGMICLYAANEDRLIRDENLFYDRRIVISQKDIREYANNEQISLERMIKNLLVFCEAQKHNIGLNRKVSIDGAGEIKNFLSHNKSYGNVNDTALKDVVLSKEFKEKWFISNDQIAKCKDCQYRYSCVNNSDIEKIDDLYRRTTDCGFDPYSNTWNSTNAIKENVR